MKVLLHLSIGLSTALALSWIAGCAENCDDGMYTELDICVIDNGHEPDLLVTDLKLIDMAHCLGFDHEGSNDFVVEIMGAGDYFISPWDDVSKRTGEYIAGLVRTTEKQASLAHEIGHHISAQENLFDEFDYSHPRCGPSTNCGDKIDAHYNHILKGIEGGELEGTLDEEIMYAYAGWVPAPLCSCGIDDAGTVTPIDSDGDGDCDPGIPGMGFEDIGSTPINIDR